MTDLTSTGKNKVLYVEILRILAIVFVVFNHTHQYGYIHFTLYDIGSFPYWFFMGFAVFTGFSVRLFFMISGMLLLNKQDESIGTVWKKRISKYVILLLVFSFWYYLRECRYNFADFSVKDFFTRLYSGKLYEPFWFLYIYIAFLIGLPFLRKLASKLTDKEFLYAFVIQIFFNGILVIFQYRAFGGSLEYYEHLNPLILTYFLIFYPLFGYYLGNRVGKITNKMLIISFSLFLLFMAATMYITNYRILVTGDLGEEHVGDFFGALMSFQVVFIFLAVRKLFDGRKIPEKIQKIIINFGSCVLGIYLIEGLVREDLFSLYEAMSSKINGFVAIWIYVLIVVLICWLIVAAVRFLIGFVKKLTR